MYDLRVVNSHYACLKTAQLAPWGSAPTPLLPLWYRWKFSRRPLPRSVGHPGSHILTIGDIDGYWDHMQPPACLNLRTFVDLVDGSLPPSNLVIVPPGTGREFLVNLPCKTCSLNTLHAAGLLEGRAGIEVGDLIRLKHFGIVSLLEFMCVVERPLWIALGHRTELVENQYQLNDGSSRKTACTEHNVHYPHVGSIRPQGHLWAELADSLAILIMAASEFYGARTIGDALSVDLARLARMLGIEGNFDDLQIDRLATESRMSDRVVERIGSLLATKSAVDTAITLQYLHPVGERHVTLRMLASEFQLSTERIRQRKIKIERQLDNEVESEIETIAAIVAERLGPITTAEQLQQAIDAAVPDTPHQPEAIRVARNMLKSRLAYSCEDSICLNAEASRVAHDLKANATRLADDAGLVAMDGVVQVLPSKEWRNGFPKLLVWAGLKRLGNHLTVRATIKARIKAALISIGRPATKSEIANEANLNLPQVEGQLRRLQSVCRADKTRWGLREWIDDEYEGIAAEIIRRIREDGGETAVARLIDELPRRFGVSESSVRAYLGTAQFCVRNGGVSMADESSISLRDIRDVVDGWTAAGSPYWSFLVREKYFNGYSLIGFPAELAKSLGCAPNGSTQVNVTNPKGGFRLSLHWRLSSPTGCTLGYLAEPLRDLGAESGDLVQFIVNGPMTCELHIAETTIQATSVDSTPERILEQLKDRWRFP